jgi:hypothetical protein
VNENANTLSVGPNGADKSVVLVVCHAGDEKHPGAVITQIRLSPDRARSFADALRFWATEVERVKL